MPAAPHDSERERKLIEDIAKRLKTPCAHLPPDQFAELVRDIARVTLKYEGKVTPILPDRTVPGTGSIPGDG